MIHPSLNNYKIIFSQDALKKLNKLEKNLCGKILQKIKELRTTPQNLNIKKLKSTKYNVYRLRVGNFRVLYTIDHDIITIHIVKIGHRKNVYNKIK